MPHVEFEQRDGVVRNLSSTGKTKPHVRMGKGLHDIVHSFKTSANDELRELSYGQSGNEPRAAGFVAADRDAFCAARDDELRELS